MQIKHKIEPKKKYTLIYFEEKPEFIDMVTAVKDIALSDKTDKRLWIFAGGINLSNSELEQIAEYANRTLKAPSISALVTSEDLSFGLLKILEAHRDQKGHTIKVFRGKTEAANWLEFFIKDKKRGYHEQTHHPGCRR